MAQKLYLLDQFNAGLQIESEIDECPLDSFPLVFLLLEHEHVMIEKLLQFLVHEINPQLLERISLNHMIRGFYQNSHIQTSKISNPAMSRTPM